MALPGLGRRSLRAMLHLAPVMLAFSGLWLPLGVLTYWLVSNLWALAQQRVVIRYVPTPGTPAHARYTERRSPDASGTEPSTQAPTQVRPARRQRVQPVGRARAHRRSRRS